MGIIRAAIVSLVAILLSGCVAPAAVDDMVPAVSATESAGFNGAYKISASGADGRLLTNADFQSAANKAFDQSKIFKNGPERYLVSAQVLSVVTDNWGLDLAAKVRVKWSLRGAAPDDLWEEVIATEHTATVGDNFVAAQRIVTAVEQAAKANIESAVKKLSEFSQKQSKQL